MDTLEKHSAGSLPENKGRLKEGRKTYIITHRICTKNVAQSSILSEKRKRGRVENTKVYKYEK